MDDAKLARELLVALDVDDNEGALDIAEALIVRVREDEREECAKVCEDVYGGKPAHTYASENADRYLAQDETRAACAAAIRARHVE